MLLLLIRTHGSINSITSSPGAINRKACLPRTMAVCCLLPQACITPLNAGMALSLCHAVWWGLRMHTAPRHTLQAETPVHSRLACFHVWPALRYADPKIFSYHYRGYTANFILIPTVLSWLLSPFPQEYRYYCPHYHGNYNGYLGITDISIPMSLFSFYLVTWHS